MAIFSSKKKTAAPKAPKKEVVKSEVSSVARDFSSVLRNPRITEKATMQSEAGIYAFDVASNATKKTVSAAIREFYKVTPVKVNVVNFPRKQVFVRGKWGMKGGGKKAYVYLKKGDKIEFV